jgi:uncharacterized protein (TIGR00255 family)
VNPEKPSSNSGIAARNRKERKKRDCSRPFISFKLFLRLASKPEDLPGLQQNRLVAARNRLRRCPFFRVRQPPLFFPYWNVMKSMTGYGRGECSRNGFKITVELSSVNRKQSEISVTLPRELEMAEARIRDLINPYIARGRLNVRVGLHAGGSKLSARMHLNLPLARAYAEELKRLARQLKLPGPVTLDHLARAPGVFQTDEQIVEEEDFWPAVGKAMKEALVSLVKMREREGAHLERDLAKRIAIMWKAAGRIQKHAPVVAERYRTQLLERIKISGLEAPGVDDERLLKEVVFFADRADISEELTRLQSHFKQFEDCRRSKEPVGRTLDFLAQEMNREINTIGSKANDSLISREVVTLKAELERFREQAQNLE